MLVSEIRSHQLQQFLFLLKSNQVRNCQSLLPSRINFTLTGSSQVLKYASTRCEQMLTLVIVCTSRPNLSIRITCQMAYQSRLSINRLNIIMTIDQYSWFTGFTKPFSVNNWMTGCRKNLHSSHSCIF